MSNILKDFTRAVRDAVARSIDARVMHAIIKHGGDINDALKSAETAQDVITLVAAGAVPSSAAVVEAATHKRQDVIRELMRRGAKAGTDAVLVAVTKRHLPSVVELVTNGAPVDQHVAYVAAYNGDMEILTCVLPKIEANDDYDGGLSVVALYGAIKSNRPVMVERILRDYKVCVEADMMIGSTNEVVKVLVEFADNTPEMLLAVVLQNQMFAVTQMLKRDELKDPKMFGPALYAAVTACNRGIIGALLQRGARVTIDVVAAANATHDPEIIQLIRNCM